MSAYTYQALKKTGRSVKGVLEADSERHARLLLREQQLIPIQIQALKQQSKHTRQSKLSADELSLLTRQLATLLSANIPVEEALRGVAEQSNSKTRQLVVGVRSKVLEGYSLAQALADYPQTFSELYRATVASGEQTGRLDTILEKLADYSENQRATRQKIQQALIYPSLMILVSMGIISFLLAFVVPKIIDVFTSNGQSLPSMTIALIHISSFVKSYGLYCCLAIILMGLGFKACLNKNPRLQLKWDHVLLKIPFIRYLIVTTSTARYIHTFAILFSANVPVLEVMSVSARMLGNKELRQAFDFATVRVREGTSIHKALNDTGFIKPMSAHLIASGEKSGELAAMMHRAALQMDQEIQRMTDTALTLLEPLVILFMGTVVLFIVLATLLPIFSMEQLVS